MSNTETIPPDLEAVAKLARDNARSVLAKLPVLGPVTWLMLQQPATRRILLADLEWRVLPAIVLQQAKLYMRDEAPIAFVSWARLSDDAAQRFQHAPHQLAASDWQSGSEIWIVDMFAPFGGAKEVLTDLRENVFAGQTIHQLTGSVSEKSTSIAWPAVGSSL